MSSSYEQVFNQVADSIETGVMLLDRGLRVVAINGWMVARCKHERESIIGRSIVDVFELKPDSRFALTCEQTLALGTPAMLSNRLNPVLLPLYRPGDYDNPDALLCQTISLKRFSKDGVHYCTVCVDDVTSTVSRERTLKQLAEENEIARIRAERDSKMKSEFLATMSHEIRTPMNGVLGMLGLLAKTELTKRQEHFVTLANSSANSLLHIINDILDFSKIEADRMEIEEFDFDLESLLTEIAQGQVLKARENDLELVLDIADLKRRFIKADPGRLRQILTNLISNAIKFTHAGEVSIKAGIAERDGSLWLSCKVTDTGIGIPKEKIQGLFEPFSQEDASTTRKYGGTGLGLSIAKKLCQLMNGGIRCESELGKGSCFTFEVEVKSATSEESLVMPDTNLAGIKALIVDDNHTNLVALENQLDQWQVEVEAVDSGAAALDLLGRRPDDFYQVAILDMQMPQMDGAELARRIKEQPRHEALPLLMLTSMTSRGDGNFFADLGFSGYLPKPASPAALRDSLKIIVAGGDALARAKPLVTNHHLASVNKAVDRRRRVLVAEDNEVNQQLVDALLHDTCELHFVENGQLALEAIKCTQDNEPFDLILMDCRMPVMDGYEATRAIRAGIEGIVQTEVPIVALTASAMPLDKKACLDAGMNDYLPKPINPDLLLERIDFWLNPVPLSVVRN